MNLCDDSIIVISHVQGVRRSMPLIRRIHQDAETVAVSHWTRPYGLFIDLRHTRELFRRVITILVSSLDLIYNSHAKHNARLGQVL